MPWSVPDRARPRWRSRSPSIRGCACMCTMTSVRVRSWRSDWRGPPLGRSPCWSPAAPQPCNCTQRWSKPISTMCRCSCSLPTVRLVCAESAPHRRSTSSTSTAPRCVCSSMRPCPMVPTARHGDRSQRRRSPPRPMVRCNSTSRSTNRCSARSVHCRRSRPNEPKVRSSRRSIVRSSSRSTEHVGASSSPGTTSTILRPCSGSHPDSAGPSWPIPAVVVEFRTAPWSPMPTRSCASTARTTPWMRCCASVRSRPRRSSTNGSPDSTGCPMCTSPPTMRSTTRMVSSLRRSWRRHRRSVRS